MRRFPFPWMLLAAALFVACRAASDDGAPPPELPPTAPPEPPEPPPTTPPNVTGVLIAAAPTTLAPGETAGLTARVQGLGATHRGVTWSLVQGPGRFAPATPYGSSTDALFFADSTFTGTVVVEATSIADPSRSARLSLTVSPRPTEHLRTELLAPACKVRLRPMWACEGVVTGEHLSVRATVWSTYEASAVARIPGTDRQTPLTYNSGNLVGTLDLGPLSPGQHPLEIVVTDSRGNSLVTPATFVLDRPPHLEVAEPASWQVALSSTTQRLRATCADDATECKLVARVAGQYESVSVAEGIGTLDASVDLSSFTDRRLQLEFIAEDSLGQLTSQRQTVLVVTSPSLERVATVPGQLVDVDDSRLLYATGGSALGNDTGLVVRHRSSGQDTPVPVPEGRRVGDAQLISSGVLFSFWTDDSTRRLYEYRQGSLIELDPDKALVWVKAARDHALWSHYPGDELMLRNFATGATVSVGQGANSFNDVARNGFVAFWGLGYDIHTFQDGVTRRLTNDPDATTWNTYPVTDGTLVVYRKHLVASQTFVIALHTGEQETLLTQPRAQASFLGPQPGIDYAVNGGWVAYTAPSGAGQLQVWLRSPLGETRKVSDFGTPSTVAALGPEGQIAVRTGEHLHVSQADGTLLDLGPVPGRALWVDGAWHVLVADTLFRVR
ncbi:hypothetical protein [Hyalangium rubrum]|uniref:Lipoprotein n=1 Tax=Hyalangium rubrum TaxID=3103134 RepID=A0ABU5HIQ2_9BACT|nr:hypothetical protein [Hyalangium sp. s54d21]MDY7232692.1 hypothetical protein [Hyalangium sp. s54d21]